MTPSRASSSATRARIVVDALGQAARLVGDVGRAPPRGRPAARRAARTAGRAGPGRAPRGAAIAVGVAGARTLLRSGPRGARPLPGRSPRHAGPPSAGRGSRRPRRAAGARRAISAASCSSRSSRRATSRGSSAAASSAARFSRQRSTAAAIAARSASCPPNAVEQVALPALVEQPLLVVLAVDLDERADLVGEAGRGDGRVVEPGGRSAAGRDLADRDQRLRQAVEQRLDPRGLGAVADERRVGAGAQRQPERVDEQALAGAGLAGDDVEAGSSVEAQAVDQREVGDGQLEQPTGVVRSLVSSRRQQLHLVAEQVPERLRAARLDEADRPLERTDLDDVADRDRQVLAPVDRDERLVRVDDPAADDLLRARRRPSGWPTGRRRSASRRGCG